MLVVVAGITFLAINLALRLQPLERFLLLLAAAALLAAPSRLAGRRPAWKPLADWMRSGAAALVLPLWQRFHPYLIELILLQAAVTLGQELVEPLSMPSLWMLLALALLSPQAGIWFDRRLQVWSVIAMWLGTAVLMLPSHAMPWLAISLAIAYLVLSHRWLQLEAAGRPRAPWGLGLLDQLPAAVDRATEPLLCYPLFLAIALVLANHFDHSLLTLLWATEAFGIYVFSVILRDGQIRAVALIALGTCLWRLVAVDMVQAELTTRGLVFMGVGLLMLAMNAIGSRFRSRFG